MGARRSSIRRAAPLRARRGAGRQRCPAGPGSPRGPAAARTSGRGAVPLDARGPEHEDSPLLWFADTGPRQSHGSPDTRQRTLTTFCWRPQTWSLKARQTPVDTWHPSPLAATSGARRGAARARAAAGWPRGPGAPARGRAPAPRATSPDRRPRGVHTRHPMRAGKPRMAYPTIKHLLFHIFAPSTSIRIHSKTMQNCN